MNAPVWTHDARVELTPHQSEIPSPNEPPGCADLEAAGSLDGDFLTAAVALLGQYQAEHTIFILG